MKFNKFIKLLKCGKIGTYQYYKDHASAPHRVVNRKCKTGTRNHLEICIEDKWRDLSSLELYEIESDNWHVEDETLTFKQILELSEKIGEVIVKRLEWKDLDRKKVLIISASEDGKLIQEKSHPDGYVDTVISMSRGDEEATDWIIVDE
jgi:hypothetical protein